MQLRGEPCRLAPQRGDGLALTPYRLIAVDNGIQTLRQVAPHGHKLLQCRHTMLLTHRIDHIHAFGQTLQTLGIGLDTLGVVGDRDTDILQLLNHRMQTLRNLRAAGIALAHVRHGILGCGQLLQHADLLGVEYISHRNQRLADTVGVL